MECTAHDIDFSPLHQRMQWYVDANILPAEDGEDR